MGAVTFDIGQFEQLLVNLSLNARDAMPSGGKLTIETINSELLEPEPAHAGSISAGNYVLLKITDSGLGMDPEICEKIFEPFYSTKKDGQGIGLTLIKEILRNHGFRFSLETVREGVTEFTIIFD